MNRRKLVLALVLISVASGTGLSLTGGFKILSADSPATIAVSRQFIYSAKFVCGPGPFTPFGEQALGPGFYFTDINVHNPSLSNATLSKKLVEAFPEDFNQSDPKPFGKVVLRSDRAFRIDCNEVLANIGFPVCIHLCLRKGFVSIISTSPNLDVMAVYTVSDLIPTPPGISCCPSAGNTTSIEVETVLPKLLT